VKLRSEENRVACHAQVVAVPTLHAERHMKSQPLHSVQRIFKMPARTNRRGRTVERTAHARADAGPTGRTRAPREHSRAALRETQWSHRNAFRSTRLADGPSSTLYRQSSARRSLSTRDRMRRGEQRNRSRPTRYPASAVSSRPERFHGKAIVVGEMNSSMKPRFLRPASFLFFGVTM